MQRWNQWFFIILKAHQKESFQKYITDCFEKMLKNKTLNDTRESRWFTDYAYDYFISTNHFDNKKKESINDFWLFKKLKGL